MSTEPAQDRVVLVTGASSGIGEAPARGLAAHGHHVVLGARRRDRLDAIASSIHAAGGTAEARSLDVPDKDDVAAFVDAAVEQHGRGDVMVNNAGVMPLSRLDALLVQEWDRMIDVNVRGLLHGIAAVLPHFQRQNGGHVITVASIGAHQVTPTAAVYCATKYATWAITEGLRLEVGPTIRVTTISPGVVDTELADTITDPAAVEAMRSYRARSIPPEDFGAVGATMLTAIGYAIGQPAGVDVNEMIIRPAGQR